MPDNFLVFVLGIVMVRMVAVLGFVCLAGCVPAQYTQNKTTTVAPKFFGSHEVTQASFDPAKATPAPVDMAVRVDKIGNQILAANPSIALRPQFGAISSANPELFHVGNSTVFITSGLVERCRGDADLAALLSVELANMVADREAGAYLEGYPERQPPIQVPIGNAGRQDTPDQTGLIELARFEKQYPRQRMISRPDANELARTYLNSSGYRAEDLDAIAPLLRAAQSNFTLEKHFRSTGAFQPPK